MISHIFAKNLKLQYASALNIKTLRHLLTVTVDFLRWRWAAMGYAGHIAGDEGPTLSTGIVAHPVQSASLDANENLSL